MAELALEGIDVHFGKTAALTGLDLQVSDGEFFVLLGSTGAGKTTTLRTVAGLEKPKAGRVEIGGADVTFGPPAARDVAFVFQQYSLYPHYTVFDNLAFPLRSPLRRLPKPEIEKRVTEVARMLGIESKLKNRATKLSGGEMQRVAIGRALVRQPALFLMDEPLSSLDAKLREALRVELKRIQRELGATILYVTHDQIEAMTMADRIGFLEDGRLLQVGDPRAVYSRPASIAVAKRLGSPPINILSPEVVPVERAPTATATLGIRPEDVVLDAGGTHAEIRSVEHLGADTVVGLDVQGIRLHALISGESQVAIGDRTGFSVDPRTVLFFGADGRRLDG